MIQELINQIRETLAELDTRIADVRTDLNLLEQELQDEEVID